MISDLKPYPAQKDSGVPWLGEVPEHWEVRRLKDLLRERDMRSTEGAQNNCFVYRNLPASQSGKGLMVATNLTLAPSRWLDTNVRRRMHSS